MGLDQHKNTTVVNGEEDEEATGTKEPISMDKTEIQGGTTKIRN